MPKSTPWRPQPPSIKNPKEDGRQPFDDGRDLATEGGFEGRSTEESDADLGLMRIGVDTEPPPGINWNADGSATMPSGKGEKPEVDEEDDGHEEPEPDWDQRAKDALEFSTNYLDQNYRKQWDDSLRAFNNMHPADSRYNSESFKKRSNLYVPKTRSIIRKNEAAAAAAFFSNMDRVSITGLNQGDIRQRISAELNQALLQYRLTKSIPWFQVVLGGCQDAQTMGACIWNPHWEYETRRDNESRELKLTKDQPACPLVPLENFRFDPSAHWMDPINTSPYIIELIPMFWVDVRERMERPDPKGRMWKKVDAAAAVGADNPDDSTRASRFNPRLDPTTQDRTVSDYDIVWVHRQIHRWAGTDWEWYTLRSEVRLTDPAPLEETEFHGKRPYVMGLWLLETHKAMPSSVPTLVKPLADEANELRNSRLDAVKFAINPGFFAKRGKNVDLPALVRNVPGRIVLADDIEKDVRLMERQDIPQGAYLEEDRNSQAFDDLAGNFNPLAMQQQRSPRESTRTLQMVQTPANLLTEYSLLTFCETGVRKLVEMLVLLEQHYETDKTILAVAGQKAQAYQRYGLDQITDDLLDAELTVAVNVGMGATDPVSKTQRFVGVLSAFANLAKAQPPGVNLDEVWKELMSLAGYQDGSRFSIQQNPELVKMAQQNKQLMAKLQQLAMQARDKRDSNVVKLRVARENNVVKALLADKEDKHQNLHLYVQHLMAKDMEGERAANASAATDQQGEIASRQSAQEAQQQQPAGAASAPVPAPPPEPPPIAAAPAAAPAAPPSAPGPLEPQRAPVRSLEDARTERAMLGMLDRLTDIMKANQEAIADADRALAELADTVRADIGARTEAAKTPRPRKRRGRAVMPSGEALEFQMDDEA